MKRIVLAAVLAVLFMGTSVGAKPVVVTSPTPEELKAKYVPQSLPEETYRLELDMLSQGLYYYDLPIFDAEWRKKGTQVLSSPVFKISYETFSQPFKVYEEGGRYAIIYYPQNRDLGPVFLYKEESGWVIDRTAVLNYIVYNNVVWLAIDGKYPYLGLLRMIFTMDKIVDDEGVVAYQPTATIIK